MDKTEGMKEKMFWVKDEDKTRSISDEFQQAFPIYQWKFGE